MSKKLAAGTHSIVLDVKYGSGAFMTDAPSAEELAQAMVTIGKLAGRNVSALITNMNRPLGNNIGNALEVIEAIEVLKNNGPEDLTSVCLALATQIVSITKNISYDEAEILTKNALESGTAYNKFIEWINAQGATENALNFKKADFSYPVIAETDGYIVSSDAEKVGISAVILGAGREKKDDTIDFSAGIILNKKTGDKVTKGDVIATLYSCNKASFESAKSKFLEALEFSGKEPTKEPLIYKIIK
jgi:pyrimidine-nucleoside phosphorylase